MKEKKRAFRQKGEPGYIAFMKKFNLLITLVLFALAIGIFITGLLIFESKANICSIIGALFIIPAARYMTVWILFLPYKSVTDEEFKEIYGLMKGGNILYADVLVTSTEKAYCMPFLVITGNKVFAFAKGNAKLYKVQDYMADTIRRRGCDFKVMVTDDIAKFRSLLRSADSAGELVFNDDEQRENFDRERAELCQIIESIMP